MLIALILVSCGHSQLPPIEVQGFKAKCVIKREGRVLAIRNHDKSTFDLPGGTQESGEHLLDTLDREMWEETGLAVDPYQIAGVLGKTMYFNCSAHGELMNNHIDEIAEHQWLDTSEVTSSASVLFGGM
jgi:8-oxo-dGTP pyrophosphatase MutT (NUDIX family)